MRPALVTLVLLLPLVSDARGLTKVVARWKSLKAPEVEMPAPRETASVPVAGDATVFVARYGTAKGSPVVLLHGGMGNGDHWVYQVRALADGHDVIVIDSRGHGRSTRSKTPPTYDLMTDDVIAVLDKLAVPKAAFVGWSDGGEIALKLGIHHPHRVTKLYVLGANYNASGAKRQGSHATFTTYGRRCRADYAKLSPTPKDYDAMLKWLRPLWRKSMGFTKQQLQTITAPTVLADGDHDEIVVMDQLEEMLTLIPGARLQIFTDTSHFVLWQDPTTLNAALVEFLK